MLGLLLSGAAKLQDNPNDNWLWVLVQLFSSSVELQKDPSDTRLAGLRPLVSGAGELSEGPDAAWLLVLGPVRSDVALETVRGSREVRAEPARPRAAKARVVPPAPVEPSPAAWAPAASPCLALGPWPLAPARGQPGALPLTGAQASTAVTLPADHHVPQAGAASVGALRGTGAAQEQLAGPGAAKGFMAVRTK